MLSVDEFVFSVDDVFSYNVVERRGMRPAVRVPLDVASNLVIAARGFAGDVDDAKRQSFRHSIEFFTFFKITYLNRWLFLVERILAFE